MVLTVLLACTAGTDPDTSPTAATGHPGTPPIETGTTPSDTGPPTGALRTLTVVDGAGSGTWPAGTLRHAWADVDPQREIVVGWTDDAGVLDAPAEWNSALTVPDADVTVTARIEAADWTHDARTYTLEGRTRDAWVIEAPNARGTVLFFHGAAYAIDELRDNAGSTLVMQLLRAGWTVVSVQSESEAASGTGGWSATLDLVTNTDLRNVQALIGELLADGTADAGEPVVAMGMSSGGMFAHAVGAMGLADAVVAYCAPGTSAANAQTDAPTAWYLAERDGTFPDGAADAAGFRDALDARGIATDLLVHPPTPLYDRRFERIGGIDVPISLEIAQALRAMGAVDADDQWTGPGRTFASQVTLPASLDAAQRTAVRAEIEIMAADHELYDDVAARMVAFLAAR